MKPLHKLAALATTVLLAGGFVTATAAPSLALTDSITAGGTGGAFTLSNGLPLVDSQSGYGAALQAGIGTAVPAGLQEGSALVRITAPAPTANGLISAAGEPALALRSGVPVSTTVLVPVLNGAFMVSSSVDADVRVELVSTFDAGAPGPGGSVALPAPVLRGDSSGGLATGPLTADPGFGVGVVGLGGVPSTNVRAAYLTVITEAPAAAALTVGGQPVRVSAGTSVVSTVAPVTSDGTVDVRVTDGTATTKVLVRGYVMDAAQNAATLTIANGYNTSPPGETQTVEVSQDSPALLDINAPDDAAYAVVSVQATAATATSHLHAGVPYAGRGRGIVVSAAAPAEAQLVVAELDTEGRLPLSLRNGTTTASVTVLGSLAGTAKRPGDGPRIGITAPANNAHIDLTEVGTFTITGTVTGSSANLDKVTVSADGQVLGTAEVRQAEDGHEFSFQTSVPTSGGHRFTFEATDRLGRTAATDLAVDVTVPEADDTVVSENVVIQEGEGAADLSAATDDALTFATDPAVEPGEFIVGSDDEAAPQGYLRQVIAVDSTEAGFVLHTIPAAITDVILQTDVTEQVGMITEEGTSLYPVNTAAPSDIVVDTGAGQVPAEGRMSARDITVGVDSTVGETISVNAFLGWKGDNEPAQESTDAASHEAKKAALKAEGGVGLAGEAKLSVALVFELKIVIDTGWTHLPKANLEKFKVAVEREIESSIGAEAYGSLSVEWKKELADWTIGKITFMVGPVPVYVNAEAAVAVAGSVTGEVKASIGWSAKEKQQYGFIYDGDGGLRAVSPWPPVSNSPIRIENGYEEEHTGAIPEGSIEGSLAAQIGPELEFNVSIYDAAGPVITAGALVGAEAAFETGEPIEWEVFIEGQIGASVRLEVPIVDKVLLEAEVMETATKRFSLLSGEIPWEDFWKFGPNPGDPEEPGNPGGPGNPGDDAPVGLDPIPIPEHSFEGSSMRVTLYWENQSDLDLHVQQPDGGRINYQNRGPSSTGGLLDIDAHAACRVSDLGIPGGLENVYWPVGETAAPGKYTIQIDEFDRCGFPAHAKWVLKVYVDEQLRYQQSGNTEQQFTFNLQNPSGARMQSVPDSGLVPVPFTELPRGEKAGDAQAPGEPAGDSPTSGDQAPTSDPGALVPADAPTADSMP